MMPTLKLTIPGYEYRTGRRPVAFDLMPRAAALIAAGKGPPDDLLRRAQVATWLDIGELSLHGLGALGLKQTAVGSRTYRRGDVLGFLRLLAASYERHLREQIVAATDAKAEAERNLKALARLKQRKAA